MKNEREKSDPSIVAKRPANKPETAEVDLWGGWAESAEPREGTEGNTGEQHTCRTPSRESVSQGLERARRRRRPLLQRNLVSICEEQILIDFNRDHGLAGSGGQTRPLRWVSILKSECFRAKISRPSCSAARIGSFGSRPTSPRLFPIPRTTPTNSECV